MKKVPEFSTTLILGAPRTGKTLIAVALAKDDYDEGYDIKSVTLKTTFSETISPLRLIDFDVEDCVLIIDEIYTILDARRSQGVNSDMSYFFFQCGKRNVKVIATAQLIRTVDIRVVDLLTEIIRCKKIIYPDRTVKEFRYMVSNGFEDVELILPEPVARKYIYPLYDTRQIIMPLYVSSKDVCDWVDVMAVFKEAPTKKSFEQEVKTLNPYVTDKQVSSCYDWLKGGNEAKAKRSLNM